VSHSAHFLRRIDVVYGCGLIVELLAMQMFLPRGTRVADGDGEVSVVGWVVGGCVVWWVWFRGL
jgi:hypothetical protein